MIMMQNETLIQVPKSQAKANKRQLEVRWDHEGSKKRYFMKSQNLQHHFARCQSLITNQTNGLGFSISPLMSVLTTPKGTKKWFEKQSSFEEQKCVDNTKSDNNTKILSFLYPLVKPSLCKLLSPLLTMQSSR